jgi:hypothetical protein
LRFTQRLDNPIPEVVHTDANGCPTGNARLGGFAGSGLATLTPRHQPTTVRGGTPSRVGAYHRQAIILGYADLGRRQDNSEFTDVWRQVQRKTRGLKNLEIAVPL